MPSLSKRHRQDFKKTYSMVSRNTRQSIISAIDSGRYDYCQGFCVAGVKNQWWKKKHYPSNKVPSQIFSLKSGTIKELHLKYLSKYGTISWTDFRNYTRELIKQGIMV